MTTSGNLCVVGTGIQLMGQTTIESESAISAADKLLYVVTDPVTESWLQGLNETAENLIGLYSEGKFRIDTYTEMVDRVLAEVRTGKSVCFALYGHPGVFVYPSHEAIRLARMEGFEATMLPGISAEDCLFADLGIDPGRVGCQSFEATDFLLYDRKFDENVLLVLWQICCIGQMTHEEENSIDGLAVLVSKLTEIYSSGHEVIVYEAARYPVCPPLIHRTPLGDLMSAPISGISTLVIPPKGKSKVDEQMILKLKIPESYIRRRDARRV